MSRNSHSKAMQNALLKQAEEFVGENSHQQSKVMQDILVRQAEEFVNGDSEDDGGEKRDYLLERAERILNTKPERPMKYPGRNKDHFMKFDSEAAYKHYLREKQLQPYKDFIKKLTGKGTVSAYDPDAAVQHMLREKEKPSYKAFVKNLFNRYK